MRSWFLGLLGAAALALSQVSDPQRVVDAFLDPKGIRDKRAVYTGDMLSFLNARTLGQEVGKEATRRVRLLAATDAEARYAIEITSRGAIQDWYAFVRLDQGVWKLAAIRSLQIAEVPSDAKLRADLEDRLADFERMAQATRNRELGQLCSLIWNGSVECIVARALRNTVGYLYVPDGVQPPPVTPDEWMYLEHVTGNWFVFRRT